MNAPPPPEPQLSIIIPAYNEAGRLGDGLAQIRRFAEHDGRATEVLVVDDGSTDATVELAERFVPGPLGVRVLRSVHNRGKGHAVRCGMLAAGAPRRLLCDADLSTPIDELAPLEAALDAGAEVAIGSRDMPASQVCPVQSADRRLMGLSLRALRRLVLLPDLRDTQCGFKLFTARAAEAVFRRVRTRGFGFDIEALAIARHLGFEIAEVGVRWRNDPDSRVRPLRDSVTMLGTLVDTVWRLHAGRLDEPTSADRVS